MGGCSVSKVVLLLASRCRDLTRILIKLICRLVNNNFIRQFEHFRHFGQMDRRLIMGQLMIIMLLRQLTDIYASTLFLFE